VLVLVALALTTGDVLFFGVGSWSVALCGASIASFWVAARYGRRAPWTLKGGGRPPERDMRDAAEGELGKLILKSAVAAAVILAAGYTLAQTGDALAKQTGLGSGLVGFLLIGFATSMPELSTITAALRMRRHEMALGEILGTNFVNL